MTIETKTTPQAVVLTISGRMDAVTTPEYEKALAPLIAEGAKNFVIDFKELEYISSAGLRALLATAKQLKGAGGSLHFAHVTGTVKEVFEISGFGSIFPLHDTVETALAALS